MIFNFYSYNLNNSNFEELSSKMVPISIREKLELIENEIVIEYLKKQENSPGIKTLGNEMKHNAKICGAFDNTTNDDKKLVKLTHHFTAYINTIISELSSWKKSDLFLFCLENEFRKVSHLVDSSSRDSNYIKNQLDTLSSYFIPKQNLNCTVYVIEMTYFSNYDVEENHSYSKLIRRNHERQSI